MCVCCLDAFQAHHTERTHARTKARAPKNTKTQHAAATAAKQRAKLSRPSTVRVCVRSLYGLSYAASGWTAYNPRKRSHTHARELSALNVTAGQGDGGGGGVSAELSRQQSSVVVVSGGVHAVSCGKWWVDDTLVWFHCTIDRSTILIIWLLEEGPIQFPDGYEYLIAGGKSACLSGSVWWNGVYVENGQWPNWLIGNNSTSFAV